jgi:hypothetical protein
VVIHQALNKGVWTWKILYSTYRDGNFPLTPVQWLEASFQPFSLYIVAAKAWAVFHTQDANERIILISVDWWTPFTGQLVMRHDLITERSGWCGKRLHRQLKLKSKQLYRHHVTQKIQTSWWQARVNCYSFLSRYKNLWEKQRSEWRSSIEDKEYVAEELAPAGTVVWNSKWPASEVHTNLRMSHFPARMALFRRRWFILVSWSQSKPWKCANYKAVTLITFCSYMHLW